MNESRDALRATSIAIVGMAARFPGASTIEQFWANIAGGVESITFFSDEELLAAGTPPEFLARPDFVKAAPILDQIDQFDAPFFKTSRREAELMDPQQRILLELAHETFERAGYGDESRRGLVGVFAGAGGLMSSYLLSPYHFYPRLLGPTGSMQAVANDKDYLATRISYKLNLRGPSMTIQTACSTSLVTVHLAVQSLLAGECDMALAGGITVRVPHRMGYFHSSQALLSPDGHCRAFDAAAKGTLFGSGAGLVLLKPLPQAVKDGDHIHAVIRGSAINNDGAAKLSYWAAGADGQAAAVRDALAVAEVDPATIGYIEAHGTATAMGDPVEIFGLTKAFRRHTQKNQFCAIGSVKTNLGHLEAAAGIAGLIKAALAIEHKTLPPSLHFETPNPAIDFPNTPFFVNTQCRPWTGGPRRAAVNSLGIGGTNAHAILEEAPAVRAATGGTRPAHLLTISAKTSPALRDLAESYAQRLATTSAAEFGDVCFTAAAGRAQGKHRLAVVAADPAEARRRLLAWHGNEQSADCLSGTVDSPAQAVFLFPGQGAQYPGMGRELYETQPVFRKAIHDCDAVLEDELGRSLLSILYAPKVSDEAMDHVATLQPALLAVEHALAELWKSWGIQPAAVVGHGVGEYAAACQAGVLSLEDGLKLVAARAKLMQTPACEGHMAAVLAKPDVVRQWLETSPRVSIAALNGPGQTVVAGAAAEVDALVVRLRDAGLRARLLPARHAFHTPAMAAIADDFHRIAAGVTYHKPKLRMISGLTGKPAGEEVASADYWRRHLSEPIRFVDAVDTLRSLGHKLFLEVGPGAALITSGRRTIKSDEGLWLSSLHSGQSDWQTLLSTLGRLFTAGVEIDWPAVDRGFHRRRVVLPTYPFQRQRYWIAEDKPEDRRGALPPLLAQLAAGKAEQVVADLAGRGELSADEIKLLPRLLQLLSARRSAAERVGE